MRKIIFNLLYYSGVGHLLHLINKLRGKIPVILFHRVSPVPDPCWSPLTPAQFEKTIRLLSKHYTFCSLDRLLEIKTSIQKNACCVVFDDGFYDFKLYALPVLVKYNVPVTLFVSTDNTENKYPIWTSTIDNIIINTNKSKENNEITVGKEKIILKLNSEKDLFNTATTIKNSLMNYEIEQRELLIKELKEQLPDGKTPDHPLLSWADLKEIKSMYPALINIQSHSHTHPFLPALNKNEIETELETSGNILKSKNFNSVDKLAYPIGGYDSRTIDAAKKYYSYAFKVENKSVTLKKINKEPDYLYQIPRFNIHTDNPLETFMFVNGFHSMIKRILN